MVATKEVFVPISPVPPTQTQIEPAPTQAERDQHAIAMRNSCTCGGTPPHGHS